MKAALEQADGGQRTREREASGRYFEMMSKRPWMDRIVRESEFVAPALFREYYEHLARGYARGVRAAQLAGEVDARYDPEVIAYAYTGIGNFVGMRWADWTAGGQVPEDVLDDVLELLARGSPRPPASTDEREPPRSVRKSLKDFPERTGATATRSISATGGPPSGRRRTSRSAPWGAWWCRRGRCRPRCSPPGSRSTGR